ncbi:MAG: arsenite methyltransferase [Actinomycetia bacterium]|nr:arsenite methyltransferase [Actinomycetes bacterium]
MDKDYIKKAIKEDYARAAQTGSGCCKSGCCGQESTKDISMDIGYSRQDLERIPQGADLGLGCGNPGALASIKPGETVLDLGSGAGIDCFIAASRVGSQGKVIGVDMTPEMIEKAKAFAEKENYNNVEFILGEIEDLPVPEGSVDLIISNCVINLSTRKKEVFEQAFKALKPGGRVVVSDIVLLKDLPQVVMENRSAYTSCLSGAIRKDRYLELIEQAGFEKIEVLSEDYYPLIFSGLSKLNHPDISKDLEKAAVSIKIIAFKPSGN